MNKMQLFLLAAVMLAFFLLITEKSSEHGNIKADAISALPPHEERSYAPSNTQQDVPPVRNTESVYINVPFTSQAPYGVWDAIHEETCEEAAVVMAYAWMYDIPLAQENVEYELQKIIRWERQNFETFENTSAAETALIAKTLYGIHPRLIEGPTIDGIKKELRNNSIVVMGFAGKELRNPYFTPPGPVYHMLVIRGYDTNGFFVNDPGTSRGENFHYSFETIEQSAHDWNGSSATLHTSPARAIIFSKNEL